MRYFNEASLMGHFKMQAHLNGIYGEGKVFISPPIKVNTESPLYDFHRWIANVNGIIEKNKDK